MPQRLGALLIPYYYPVDRWFNDHLPPLDVPEDGGRANSRRARMLRDGITIDGNHYDFSRFLSWIRFGTTAEYERFDSYALTLLVGSYYVSFLRRQGIDVVSANSVHRGSLDSLGRAYDPRFVLLSTTLILEHSIILEAVSQIRRVWPETIIVLGGLFLVEMHKTLPPAKFLALLRMYGADAYVVSPAGERSLLEIVRRGSLDELKTGPPIADTYVIAGSEVRLPDPSPPDPLPMDENYVRWSEHVPQERMYHTVHTRTARSCAFSCAFCNFPVNQGPLTLMTLPAFTRELDELKACQGVKGVIFTDDTFNVPITRFKQLCRVLADYQFEWYSFFRPQYADQETVRLMKESGCKAVFLGVESADDRILQNMNKAANTAKIKKGVHMLKNAGILTHASFIVGYPGETEETAAAMVDFLDETEIEFFTAAPFCYVPSTPVAKRAEEFGLSGSFETWRHHTMTSDEATALCEVLRAKPRRSVFAPDLAANEFWSEILLFSNGFTLDETQLVFRTYDKYKGKDIRAEDLRRADDIEALTGVLNSRSMPVPRNC